MKTLVLYDSVFGNTEKIALAIRDALATQGECEAATPADLTAARLQGVGRLVAGSPTRAFRPTPAIVAALQALPAGALAGVSVLAFDTRAEIEKAPGILKVMAGIFGYAAAPLAKAMTRKGGTLARPPEGFVVTGTEGPLRDGELERAVAWATTAP